MGLKKAGKCHSYLALLGSVQKAYAKGDKKDPTNPGDPYMTLLGYFNSLRELGGAPGPAHINLY